MKKSSQITSSAALSAVVLTGTAVFASDIQNNVSDDVIANQRALLAENTRGVGFGPQSPRDIENVSGNNTVAFAAAPPHSEMNLCNIHFHEGAEHKGGEFTKFIGNGDGKGYGGGYAFSGQLSDAELDPLEKEIGATEHGGLVPGDTIEVHYVYSTAKIAPGPSLASCLSDASRNPQLRVEAQVFVLVNDEDALDFVDLMEVGQIDGLHQALNIPSDTGSPVEYAGSTTGPGYNEKGSPFQVTWNVRPKVAKVDITTVADWLSGNIFNEDHAHGVRNLVVNPDLLSTLPR